jgi:hypothetical protein
MIINLSVCLKRTRMRTYDRCDRQSTNLLSKGAIAVIIILGLGGIYATAWFIASPWFLLSIRKLVNTISLILHSNYAQEKSIFGLESSDNVKNIGTLFLKLFRI